MAKDQNSKVLIFKHHYEISYEEANHPDFSQKKTKINIDPKNWKCEEPGGNQHTSILKRNEVDALETFPPYMLLLNPFLFNSCPDLCWWGCKKQNRVSSPSRYMKWKLEHPMDSEHRRRRCMPVVLESLTLNNLAAIATPNVNEIEEEMNWLSEALLNFEIMKNNVSKRTNGGCWMKSERLLNPLGVQMKR